MLVDELYANISHQLYAALEPHVFQTFERLKMDRKVPIFEDGAEPGEISLKGWAQDPLVHAEVKKYVIGGY